MSDQPPPDVDPEVWAMLPEDVRADVLRDAQRQASVVAAASGSAPNALAAAAPSGEVNIAQFLATLPPDLRSQVLLTATPEEVARMPPELRAEVDQVRMQAAVEQRDRPDRHFLGTAVTSAEAVPPFGFDDGHRSNRIGGSERTLPRDTFESPEVEGRPLLKDAKQAMVLAALRGNVRVSSVVRSTLESALVSLTLQPEARTHLVYAMLEMEAFPMSRRPRGEPLHFLAKVFDARPDARAYAVQTHSAALFALLSKMQSLDNSLAIETDSPTAVLKVVAILADQLKRTDGVDERPGLVALSGLLSWDDCPEDLFSLACAVAKGLVSAEPERSKVLLSSLTAGTAPLVLQVAKDLAAIADRLETGGSAEDEPVTSTEVRLLRAVKTIKTLQVEGAEDVLSTVPLQGLWTELARALGTMEQRILKANKAAADKEAVEKAEREQQRLASAAATHVESEANSADAAAASSQGDTGETIRGVIAAAERRRVATLRSRAEVQAQALLAHAQSLRNSAEANENENDLPELISRAAANTSSSSAAASNVPQLQTTDNAEESDDEDFPELFTQLQPGAQSTVGRAGETAAALPARLDLGHLLQEQGAAEASSSSVPDLDANQTELAQLLVERTGMNPDEAALVLTRALDENSRHFLRSLITDAPTAAGGVRMAALGGSNRAVEETSHDMVAEEDLDHEDEDEEDQDEEEEREMDFQLDDRTAPQPINALQQLIIREEERRFGHMAEDDEEGGGHGGIFGEEDEESHDEEEEEEEEDEEDGDGAEEEEEEEDEAGDEDEDGMGDDDEHDLDDILQNLHGLHSQRRPGAGGHHRNHLSKVNVPGLTRFLPVLGVYFEANGDESAVEKFGLEHALVLNTLVRNSPKVLRDSLKALVTRRACRKVLTFENKRAFFKHGIKQLPRPMRPLRLSLRRDHVVEDSIAQLGSRTPEEMRGGLSVMFRGEEGIDAGGVSREWFEVLIREMFKPDYALFKQSADSTAFQPDPRSYFIPENEANFKFVGRIVGKALLEGYYIPAHFTRSFYKHVVGREVTPNDLQSLDPQYHKSLMDILSMEDVSVLDLNFTTDIEEFGKRSTVPLLPNGASISVTNENRHEWVKLVAQQKMTGSIRKQIDAFLVGFYEMIPKELIQMFNPQELELLISGMPKIDLEDLMRNTEYNGGFARDASQIDWFWRVLRSLDEADKARFLMFVTGTSKVPLEGFANLVGMRGIQRFSIHRGTKSDEMLPTAHTCFNQLDLPQYSCEEVLREKLLKAIREGSEGFGFA